MAQGLSLVFWALFSVGTVALIIGVAVFLVLFREQQRRERAQQAKAEREEGIQGDFMEGMRSAATTAPSAKRGYPPVTVQGFTARRRRVR